ncbi:PPE family protein [Mycobacterium haemophilum]
MFKPAMFGPAMFGPAMFGPAMFGPAMFGPMMFAARPPEVNASLFFNGPGVDSIVTAAEAWQNLADKLDTTSKKIAGLLNELTAAWHGPAATQMFQAAAPYQVWLRRVVALADVTATHTKDIAEAYQTARKNMPSPAMIEENRRDHEMLCDTNELGRNTHLIQQNEQQYQTYWENAAKAMGHYTLQAFAALAPVTPFTPPPAI